MCLYHTVYTKVRRHLFGSLCEVQTLFLVLVCALQSIYLACELPGDAPVSTFHIAQQCWDCRDTHYILLTL